MHTPVQKHCEVLVLLPLAKLEEEPDSQVETNSAPPTATLRASGTGHGEALERDFSLAFVQGLPLATLSVWCLPFAL